MRSDSSGERYRDGLAVHRRTEFERERGPGAIVWHSADPVSHCEPIDLTIDGADEIGEADLRLIKGMGGALLREKIVAVTSRQAGDHRRRNEIVAGIDGPAPVPVEVVAFGWESTKARLLRWVAARC